MIGDSDICTLLEVLIAMNAITHLESRFYSFKTISPRKEYGVYVAAIAGDKGGEGHHGRPGGLGQVLGVHRRNHQENRAKLICQMIKHFFVTNAVLLSLYCHSQKR